MKALDVARLIIGMQAQVGKGTTNLALQKLVFYCQAYHLAFLNIPLFDEDVEAWMYGPVIPAIYEEYKKYGTKEIELEDFDIENLHLMNDDSLEIVSLVLSKHGELTPMQLVNMTHQEKPWKNAYKLGKKSIIHKQVMQEYYKTFIVNT